MLLKALQHGHGESKVFRGVSVPTGGPGTQVELPSSQRGKNSMSTQLKPSGFPSRRGTPSLHSRTEKPALQRALLIGHGKRDRRQHFRVNPLKTLARPFLIESACFTVCIRHLTNINRGPTMSQALLSTYYEPAAAPKHPKHFDGQDRPCP